MKISIIAPIYNYYPILVPSLVLQTHNDWELILIHDGPDEIGLFETVESFRDKRIRLIHTTKRYNDWGHSLREIGLELVTGEYVIHTNADNYYVPVALNAHITEFCVFPHIIGTYSNMIHSHRYYTFLGTELELAMVDCGCVMLKTEIAKEAGWKSRHYCADWYVIEPIVQKYGRDKFRHIQQPLLVHN